MKKYFPGYYDPDDSTKVEVPIESKDNKFVKESKYKTQLK